MLANVLQQVPYVQIYETSLVNLKQFSHHAVLCLKIQMCFFICKVISFSKNFVTMYCWEFTVIFNVLSKVTLSHNMHCNSVRLYRIPSPSKQSLSNNYYVNSHTAVSVATSNVGANWPQTIHCHLALMHLHLHLPPFSSVTGLQAFTCRHLILHREARIKNLLMLIKCWVD